MTSRLKTLVEESTFAISRYASYNNKNSMYVTRIIVLAIVYLCSACGIYALASELSTDPEGKIMTESEIIKSRAKDLPKPQQEIAECIGQLIESGVTLTLENVTLTECMNRLGYKEGMSIADAVDKDGELYQTLAALFGGEWAELIRKYWEREIEYPFPILCSKDWVIEHFTLWVRSREPYRHFRRCLDVLAQLGDIALERDVGGFIEDAKNDFSKQGARLGLLLDDYDTDNALFERLKNEILTKGPDAREAEYCGNLFTAMLASHREDVCTFLREKILLNFDDRPHWVPKALFWQLVPRIPRGTLASQIRMCEVMGMGIWEEWEIREITGWFGLDPRMIGPEFWGRIDEVIHTELTDRNPSKRTITGPVNPFVTYIALWAESQYSIEDAVALAQRIIENSEDELKANALWFAHRLDKAHWRLKIAASIFADARLRRDPLLMALAVTGAIRDFRGVKIVDKAVDNVCDGDVAHLTREERDTLFTNLLAVANEMIAANKTERVSSFGWVLNIRRRVGYTVDDVARLMALLVACEPSESGGDTPDIRVDQATNRVAAWGRSILLPFVYNDIRITNTLDGQGFERSAFNQGKATQDVRAETLRDTLCVLLPYLDAEARNLILRYVVRDGTGSPMQYQALVDAYRLDARRVWNVSRQIAFSAEDNLRLESFLAKGDDSGNRAFILLKLLEQSPVALGETIARLVTDHDPRRYRAGWELLTLLEGKINDPIFSEIYKHCQALAESGANPVAFNDYFTAVQRAMMDDLGLGNPSTAEESFSIPSEIEEQMRLNKDIPKWLEDARKDTENDDARFARLVRLVCAYMFAPWSKPYGSRYLSEEELWRAWRLGILSEKDFIRLVVALGKNGNYFFFMTDPELSEKHLPDDPEVRQIIDAIIDRVVFIETRRGDIDTPVSNIAEDIRLLNGARYFMDVLKNLELDYATDSGFVLSQAKGGRFVALRHFITVCRPLPDETMDDVRKLISPTIPLNALSDIASFAPQWRGLIRK